MGYGLCDIGSPVVGMSISNRLVPPKFVEDLNTMLLNFLNLWAEVRSDPFENAICNIF